MIQKQALDTLKALYGLMEAQKAQGDTVAAAKTEKQFIKALSGNIADLSLRRL